MKVVPVSETVMAYSFNHQGRSVTVIDMHSKFGLPFSVNKNKTHIILATVENELKGFWVDKAINVVLLSSFEKDKSGPRPLSSAFSRFLLRDRESVLQTSFNRLFKCQGSDLSWIAGDKTKEKVQPDELIEPVTNEDSGSSISAEVIREKIISNVLQPDLPFTSNKNKNSNKASAANTKTAGELRKNKPAPVISLAEISARLNSKNRQRLQADNTTIASTTRAYSNRVLSISAHKNKIANRRGYDLNNKPDNKSENRLRNKRHALLLLVMLAIIALGWGIGYLMSVNMNGRIDSMYSSLSVSGSALLSQAMTH